MYSHVERCELRFCKLIPFLAYELASIDPLIADNDVNYGVTSTCDVEKIEAECEAEQDKKKKTEYNVEVWVHLEGDNEEEWSDLEKDNDDEWSDLEEDYVATADVGKIVENDSMKYEAEQAKNEETEYNVEVSVHLEGDNEEEWSDLEEDNDDEWSDLEEDNGEGFIASNGAIDQLERTLVELRDRDQASLRNMVEEGVVTRKRKYKTQNKNLVSVTGQKGRWFEVYMNEVPMSIRDFWAALRNGDHDMNDLLRRSILETAGFGKDLYGYDMVLIEFKDFSAFENKSLDNVMEFTVRLQKGGNCRKEEFAKVRANLDSNTVASAYRGANKNIFIVPNQIQSLHGSARRKNFSNLINFVRNAAEDVHINFWKKVAALVPTEFFLKQHLMHDYEEGERIYVYIPESPDEIGWLRVGIVGENSHGTLDVLNEDSYKYSFSRK